MSKFETPPDLPVHEYSVLVEVCVHTIGHREAAEEARLILMSDKCPTTFIVSNMTNFKIASMTAVFLD